MQNTVLIGADDFLIYSMMMCGIPVKSGSSQWKEISEIFLNNSLSNTTSKTDYVTRFLKDLNKLHKEVTRAIVFVNDKIIVKELSQKQKEDK